MRQSSDGVRVCSSYRFCASGRFCFLVAIAHALAKRTPRRSECGSVYGTHATLGHGPAVDALGARRAVDCQPADIQRKDFMKYLAVGTLHLDGFSLWTSRACSSG